MIRWYRRGRSKWTSFNSIENEILEDSYKNRSTSDQVFRFGTKGIVNIPERTLTSDSGFLSIFLLLLFYYYVILKMM